MRWDLKNEEELKKITKRIMFSYTKITKRTNGADDCAQEVLEYFIKGHGKSQTIGQAVIDYLRRDSGRKGLPGYSQKQNLNNANSIESVAFRNLSDEGALNADGSWL